MTKEITKEPEKRIFYDDIEDIPIGKFEDLGYTLEELSNIEPMQMTIAKFREFFNILIKEGPLLTRETPLREIMTLQETVGVFLDPSRLDSAKEALKEKRSPTP